MSKNIKTALLRYTCSENASEEELLDTYFGNTGNLVYWETLDRLFKPEIVGFSDSEIERLKTFDNAITTDLIWIKENAEFPYLEKVVEAVDIPIIPISVGLQSSTFNPNFQLSPRTLKLLKTLEKKATLGVRGYYTAEILKRYGITNIEVIGCPSLYYWNNPNLQISEMEEPKNICCNFRTFYGLLTKPETQFLEYCAQNNFKFYEQTKHKLCQNQLKDLSKFEALKDWLNTSSEMFYDCTNWSDSIKSNNFDFSIGGRFHGNIIALQNNAKALFLTSDTRTDEMTDLFHLPKLNISNFDPTKSIEYYFKLADYSEFNKTYPLLFKRFVKFATNNGLVFNKDAKPLNFIPKKENKKEMRIKTMNNLEPIKYLKPETIYYCKTVRQLFCSLLLSKNNPETSNYLFVNTWLHNLFPYMDKMLCNPPFNFQKIIVYDIAKITPPTTSDENQLVGDIVKYFDGLLESNHIDLNSIEEINIFSSLRFSIYLSEKKKNFNLFEDGNGSALKAGLVQWREQTDKVTKRNLAAKYGLILGDSKYVEKIRTALNDGLEKFPQKKLEYFSPNKLLEQISKEDVTDLYNFFNNSNVGAEKEYFDYMILTQFYDINTPLPKDIFWGIIADCFIPDNKSCSIKAHPNDNTDFSKVFKNDKVYNKNIPFEIIEKCVQMKNTITISSSSTKGSKVNDFHLGLEYMKFNPISSLVILNFVNNIFPTMKFTYIGSHLTNFKQLVESKFNNIFNNFVDNANNANVVIYENFYSFENWSKNKNQIVISLTKNENSIENNEIVMLNLKSIIDSLNSLNDVVLIYCQDQDIVRKLKDYTTTLTLKRSNISISIKPLNVVESLKQQIEDLKQKYESLEKKLIEIENNIIK